MRRSVLRAAALFAALILSVLAAAGWFWAWASRPLELAAPAVALSIAPGDSPRQVAEAWVRAGVRTDPGRLHLWFRLSGDSRRIRAGAYEIETGISPRQLLAKMVAGDEAVERVTLIEGWTFAQVRAELARAPALAASAAGLSDERLMAAIGAAGISPEGRFFPDTYVYSRGASDLSVLRRAYAAMRQRLAAAWASRNPGLPLRSADDALVLASIVEKETGRSADRGKIAAVFVNRLRMGMPLQTDPAVIYGLGDAYDGRLHKRDLERDTPYNTYLRAGLPPTPISMPGLAALRAVVDPPPTKALYFVARGDGGSEFSEDLESHNRAVDRFQRKR